MTKFSPKATEWLKVVAMLFYSSWRILMAVAGACVIGYEAFSYSPDYENPRSSTSHYMVYAVGIGLILSPMLTAIMVVLYLAIMIAWGSAVIYGTVYAAREFGGIGAALALPLLIGAPLILIGVGVKLTALFKKSEKSIASQENDPK